MAKKAGELTPMMKQFYDLKAKHPEALLLFRCGDFYETYCDDAVTAAEILGITLTRRNNGGPKGSSLPTGEGGGRGLGDAMAGFPYHALDTYLPRLIRAGRRVAICDQLEDPKKTKTLVKRGITELVTPGVAMQDNVLHNKENNFLCAVAIGKGAIGIALLDISTGEFMCGEGNYDYALKIIDTFQPKEVIYDRTHRNEFFQHFPARLCTYDMDDWAFTLQSSEQKLRKHFQVKTLKGFGVDHLKNGITAAGAILFYLDHTEHTRVEHIVSLQRLDTERYVRMDGFTVRSLELIHPLSEGGVSLLQVIDKTSTAMGGRMLNRWIKFPLKDVKQIISRQNIVEYYFRNPEFRDIIDEQLHRIADMERIIAKISTRRVNPREMRSLSMALDAVNRIKYECLHTDNSDLMTTGERLDPCQEMKQRIEREIKPEPPLLLVKGGVVNGGVNAELDRLREIMTNGKAYLLKLQQREAEKTGIASLKIGYNNVFGYYLEVRNTYKDNVPENWIRKQTLAQAERYITPELKQYEDEILGAEEKIVQLEQQIFAKLVDDCSTLIKQIQMDAFLVAELDCLLSFALISQQYRYNRPVIDDSTVIDIKAGRHPVIETQMEIGEEYVPNDVKIEAPQGAAPKGTAPKGTAPQGTAPQGTAPQGTAPQGTAPQAPQVGGCLKNALDTDNNCKNILDTPPSGGLGGLSPSGLGGLGALPQIIIITGPNMAGKSALLRQTALIVVLAQMGCFVPAESAKIGVVDRIFTRVGASDNIAAGESTFMVEMTEASNILNNVTDRSLVLFDELGRGTSTYDGISIAWAIVEYIHENKKGRARTLFATHYHELNEMAQHFSRIRNYNVSVIQKDGKVIFLRKLVEGGSEHSFGIHVAELAGMPKQIIQRANIILKQLEDDNSGVGREAATVKVDAPADGASKKEMSFFQLDDPVLEQIRDTLLHLDVNNLTPLQALNKLNEIKGILKG